MIGVTTVRPIIGEVKPKSIAALADLKPNQQITKIDDHEINSWAGMILRILAHAGDQDTAKIETRHLKDKKIQNHFLDLTHWKMNELTPDPLSSLGITPYMPTIPLVIGVISKDSPAALSNLKIGDKIIAINKKQINTWEELTQITLAHPEKTVLLTLARNGKILDLPIKLSYQRLFFKKYGYLGIGPSFKWPPELLHNIQYGPLEAASHAWKEMLNFTYFNFLLLGKMITGKISLQSLGGPITIFESAGEALNFGLLSFISFLAFLSISIGVINLLPIPGLDGGHLFFQIIEVIIRRPVPENILLAFYRLGFLFIFFILLQALINDILRLY